MTSITVNLNTDGPCDPQYVLEVAEAFAEAVRVLNHLTRDPASLEYPAEVDGLIRDVSLAVARLPQLLGQVGGRLEAMREAGILRVVSDDYLQTTPDTAVMRTRVSLDEARAFLEGAQASLEAASRVTSGLAAVPDAVEEYEPEWDSADSNAYQDRVEAGLEPEDDDGDR